MSRFAHCLAAAAALLAPAAALACGGFFASEVEVRADQKIVVVHRAGLETYVFRPHFCGAAKDFGVILPIPATLAASPTLADDALFDQLDDFTRPEVVEVCASAGPPIGCGVGKSGGLSNGDGGDGVNVVERGRVGAFEYALLQATTVNAFTDWLDQNGFPHGSSTDTWQHYVTRQWYFVAFKVNADSAAPPAGMKLCGDLGPIQLSFASTRPVVPARIAAVNGSTPLWRVFVVAPTQQRADSQGGFGSSLYFSGSVGQADLGARPALAALARDGDRLTALDVRFPQGGATDDLLFLDEPSASDHRTTVTVTKQCTGCAAGGSVIDVLALSGVLLLLRNLHRPGSGA